MAFDIAGARQAGATDDQIAQYLSQEQPQFDVQGALKAGASLDQIANEIENPAPKSTASKIYDKLKSISPELVNPMNAIPQVAGAKIGNALMNKSNQGWQMMANMANEAMGKRGVNPYVSAALTTPVAMANDLAGAAAVGSPIAKGVAGEVASGGLTAPIKSLGQDIGAIGQRAGQAISGGFNKLGNMTKTLTGPGEIATKIKYEPQMADVQSALNEAKMGKIAASQPTSELLSAQQAIPAVKAGYGSKIASTESDLAKQGNVIKQAEQAAGLTSDDISIMQKLRAMGNDKVSLNRLDTLNSMAKKGPDYIASELSPQTIYKNMKLSQEMAKNAPDGSLESGRWSKMNTTLRQALSQTKPDFTRELDNLKQMSDSLDNLKTQRGLDVSNLQAKIGQLKAQLSSNKVDAVNKVMAAQENFNNLKAEYRMATLKGKQSDLSRTRLAYGAAATGVVGGGAGALLKALLHK